MKLTFTLLSLLIILSAEISWADEQNGNKIVIKMINKTNHSLYFLSGRSQYGYSYSADLLKTSSEDAFNFEPWILEKNQVGRLSFDGNKYNTEIIEGSLPSSVNYPPEDIITLPYVVADLNFTHTSSIYASTLGMCYLKFSFQESRNPPWNFYTITEDYAYRLPGIRIQCKKNGNTITVTEIKTQSN